MHSPNLPNDAHSRALTEEVQALQVENKALQAENKWLHTQRLEQAENQQEEIDYQQSQVRFRTVFEHSPLGMKIISPDLAITNANAAVAEMLGFSSPKELIGHRILTFAHPDYHADWLRLQKALWTQHIPSFALETCLIRRDGSLLWCRVTSVLFPEAGQDYGFTTLEDISVRKALEAQHQQSSQQLSTINEALLITNEELASTNEELITTNTELQLANTHLAHTNAELDSFVYAASHDLKAPIVNLEGLLLALTQQLPAEVRRLDQVAPILEMMQDAIVRFRHTLDYLTDIGSIQVDGTRPREKISLAGVVEEVRRDVEPLLFTTGGRLEVDLADNPTLFYYPGNLRSVVYNLISNALKYRHPDRPPVVYVQSQRNRNQLLLRVQDNGLGLSAEQQLQLFRLFRRLHSHVDGSGVGLYLVKKILDTTGGSIRVESQLGRGSTFTVTFPS